SKSLSGRTLSGSEAHSSSCARSWSGYSAMGASRPSMSFCVCCIPFDETAAAARCAGTARAARPYLSTTPVAPNTSIALMTMVRTRFLMARFYVSSSIGSMCDQPRFSEQRTRPLDHLGRCRLDAIQLVVDPEAVPLVPAQLVKRQDVHALHVAEVGRESGDARNGFGIVRQPRHQDESKPGLPSACGEAPRKVAGRPGVHPRQDAMTLLVPFLDVEQHEIDRFEL